MSLDANIRHPFRTASRGRRSSILLGLALIACQVPQGESIAFNPVGDDGEPVPMELHAELSRTDQPGVALVVHGLRGSSDDVREIAALARAAGWATLVLDLRGHGRSQGSFPFENPSEYGVAADDVRGALAWLRDSLPVPRTSVVMIGISLGGGAVIANALEDPELRFIAWYPGLTYLAGGDSLVVRADPRLRGTIIQGNGPGIERANAGWTRRFAAANPGVTVRWLDGLSHGTSPGRSQFLDITHEILSQWQVP